MHRPPIPAKLVEQDGRVPVYSLQDKVWRRMWPIDARECLACGTVALEEPAPEPAAPPKRATKTSSDATA